MGSELKSARASGAVTTGADITDYWHKASAAGSAVAAMRGGDCMDTDLCFGTQTTTGCICRVMDSPTSTPAPTPTPSPSDCPGGSLNACIDICPRDPEAAYKVCVNECLSRCSSESMMV